jgi:hypothetical protein
MTPAEFDELGRFMVENPASANGLKLSLCTW